MFLPANGELARLMPRPNPNVSPAALPVRTPRDSSPEPSAPFRSKHPVQVMPAFASGPPAAGAIDDEIARQRAAFYAEAKARALAHAKGRAPAPGWYEDPIALGTLLLLLPPVGLAALWSSKRYSNDARWALTVMTGLTLCVGAAVAVAVLALRT
jgi:hypothetical protein